MALVFSDKSLKTGPTVFTPLQPWINFRISNAKILYQPNVYQGDGSENRVNICLESDEATQQILEYEKHLNGNICSCIKEDHVKAKLSWDTVRFFDITGDKTERPQMLAGYLVNVVFRIKGKWSSHQQTGLSLEVSDIQLLQPRETENSCPFEDLSH